MVLYHLLLLLLLVLRLLPLPHHDVSQHQFVSLQLSEIAGGEEAGVIVELSSVDWNLGGGGEINIVIFVLI